MSTPSKDFIIATLAIKFPQIFASCGSAKAVNALASNVADAILAALPGASVEVIEQCAKVAENPGFVDARDTEWDLGFNYAKKYIAGAIRALVVPSHDSNRGDAQS